MAFGNLDSDFDHYRKQRIRFKNKEPIENAAQYENSTLRELEQVEAREIRDQQLTREVHDFFADATRQAATIVERMAQDAEAEADIKIDQEMESFLMDAFARMNGLVMNMLQQKKMGNTAEEKLEPKVANLVGEVLDEFRWEGTADLLDKHIGQDPFETDLDDVRREFKTHVSDQEMDDAVAPIEEHLVASVSSDAEAEADDEPADSESAASPGSETVVEHDVEEAPEPQSEPAPEAPPASLEPSPEEELERFKQALRALVRQGTMSRDEARAAWATRLRSLGLVRG